MGGESHDQNVPNLVKFLRMTCKSMSAVRYFSANLANSFPVNQYRVPINSHQTVCHRVHLLPMAIS